MTPSSAPLRFGPFELLEPLGGGMSIVYRARRDGDPRELAVKVLRQDRLLDGESRARFTRELHALRQLSHPGICPLLDAGEVDGMPYLCMPLLRGRSLANHLDAARQRSTALAEVMPGHRADEPGWRTIVATFARFAEALQVAHEQGFVHRDVKPANLWIGEQGEPLLLDFGLARDRADRYRHLTRTGQIVGTPTYLAPEQLDARLGPVGVRADVHGLAASLYEALTLEPPFSGRSRAELFASILAGPVPDVRRLRPELPEALAGLLGFAMARRQAERCPSAASLAADLRAVLAGESLANRRAAFVPRVFGWVRQWPLRAATAGALAVAVAIASPTFARVAFATTSGMGPDAREDASLWVGRHELACTTYERLPPPWPQHCAELASWVREHGRPLLRAPEAASRRSPGLSEYAQRALAQVERLLASATALQERGTDVDAARWAAARAAVADDGRFQGLLLHAQPGLVPLGADPRSQLQEFYDLASGDPALPVPSRDAAGQLVLAEHHGIVFVLLPGGRYQPFGGPEQVVLRPFLLAKHEVTRAQYARLDPGPDPCDVPLGVWNGELQTWRHAVNQLRYFEAQELLRHWGLGLPTEVQWEYAARAGSADMTPAWPGNYSGGEDGYRRSAPVGSYGANDFGFHDLLGNLSEPCADAAGTRKLAARDGDGLRAAQPEQPRRTVRGGCYGSIRWGLAGTCVLEADQRESWVGLRPMRVLEES